jgi:hypothetical protein
VRVERFSHRRYGLSRVVEDELGRHLVVDLQVVLPWTRSGGNEMKMKLREEWKEEAYFLGGGGGGGGEVVTGGR